MLTLLQGAACSLLGVLVTLLAGFCCVKRLMQSSPAETAQFAVSFIRGWSRGSGTKFLQMLEPGDPDRVLTLCISDLCDRFEKLLAVPKPERRVLCYAENGSLLYYADDPDPIRLQVHR